MRLRNGLVMVAALAALACRPSDILTVPPPAGVVGASGTLSQEGAETILAGATGQFFAGTVGNFQLFEWTELFTDETTWAAFTFFPNVANIDARSTVAQRGYEEEGDYPLQTLLSAHSQLLQAADMLAQYEPKSGKSKVGEALALAGYSELFIAEDYCAGVTLSRTLPSGGIEYGMPLTTDSLLGTAITHFDSALVYATGNDTVQSLASVGLARALVDRGDYSDAAAAVSGVATSFVFNTVLQTQDNGPPYVVNLYTGEFSPVGYCPYYNVADREGGNGLNFISAGDPRLVIDSTLGQTCDGQYGPSPVKWYYPDKFGNPATGLVPLATGVEARLIEAEAALQGGNAATWANDLNALRMAAPTTYLQLSAPMDTLTTDSTLAVADTAQVSLMFREREFWLYGTGTRLGDLRRLIRNYHRDQSVVFPAGTYAPSYQSYLPSPLPTYGTDVAFTLPTQAGGLSITNPHYKGCLVPVSQA